jgi:Domain of unknown function (DUF4157)/LysM domain
VASRLTRAVKPPSAPARAQERPSPSPLSGPEHHAQREREEDYAAIDHHPIDGKGHHFGLVDLVAAPAPEVAPPGPGAAPAGGLLELSKPEGAHEQEAERAAAEVARVLAGGPSGGDEGSPSAAALRLGSAPASTIHRTSLVQIAGETFAPGSMAEPGGGGLIVEDEAEALTTGQLKKSAFMELLRAAARETAEVELKKAGRSSKDCPYLERALAYYAGRPADKLERSIRRYAPETAQVVSAREYIPLVSARLARGIATWARTGEMPDVPEELRAGQAGGLIGIVAGIGSAVAAIGRALFKREPGAAGRSGDGVDATALHARLGPGRPLEGGVRSRMEGAFGHHFGHVCIHADEDAAALSRDLQARAFAVGSHVAFGRGEYHPGDPVGDALLAHELAHVVQQGGGTRREPLTMDRGPADVAEREADDAATGVVLDLHLRPAGGRRRGLTRRSSAPAPQRCGDNSPRYPESSPKDLRAGAGLPTEAQQKKLLAAMGKLPKPEPDSKPTPTPVGEVGKPVDADIKAVAVAEKQWRGHKRTDPDPKVQAELDKTPENQEAEKHRKQLKDAMFDIVDTFLRKADLDKMERNAANRKDIGEFEGPARGAQKAVQRKFGDWIGSAALSGKRPTFQFHAGKNLLDLGDPKNRALANFPTPEFRFRKLVTSDEGFASVMESEFYNPENEGQEQDFFDAVAQEYVKDKGKAAKLDLLSQVGVAGKTVPTATPGEKAILIQTHHSRFEAYAILVHEYLHVVTHPIFSRMASLPMKEGFTEMFTHEVLDDGVPSDIEADVEQGLGRWGRWTSSMADYKATKIYENYLKMALKLREQLGSAMPKAESCSRGGTYAAGGFNAMKGAYFQGHVELIGLNPEGKPGPTADAWDRIVVPKGVADVGRLAAITGVSSKAIADANRIKEDATLTPGQSLRVPGCRDHIVVADEFRLKKDLFLQPETQAQIARQHGVDPKALTQANPELVWSDLKVGDHVLVPMLLKPTPAPAQVPTAAAKPGKPS